MNKYLKIGIIAAAVLGLGYLLFGNAVSGQVSKDIAAPDDYYQNYTFFASTTDQTIYATTTSAVSTSITPYFAADGRKDNGYFVIAGAEEITFYFSRTGVNGNAGMSKFDIDVSDDGVNWYDYNYLQQNDVSLTATTTVTIAGTTTAIVHLKDRAFYAVRCSVVETTDGEHSCRSSARF